MFKQGDIVLLYFPFSDLSGGKRRPALILSSGLVNATPDLVCVQITSKKFYDNLFFELAKSAVSPPLILNSGIRIHKLFTAEQRLVSKKIGILNPESLKTVLRLINEKVFEL